MSSHRRRGWLWKAALTVALFYILITCFYTGVHLPSIFGHERGNDAQLEDLSVDEVIRGEWRRDSGPVLYYPRSCRPRRNLAFIKCMKCGTETTATALRRYVYINDLSVVLPVGRNLYLGWPFPITPLDYRPSSHGYNFLIEHAVYNASVLRQLMNADTAFVTVIREPLDMFVSVLNYFNVFEIANVSVRHGMEAVVTYLRDIRRYEEVYKSHAASSKRYCIPDGFSVTRNLLAHCLGMPLGFPDSRSDISGDPAAVTRYIDSLDLEFELVMLMEYLDESLVLLRRLMCWDVKDIVYRSTNRGSYHRNLTWALMTPDDRRLHRQWSAVDYALHAHFNRTFWQKVAEQGEDFNREVEFFRLVQEKVSWFCDKVTVYGQSFLRFPESRWSGPFTFSSEDCQLMGSPLLEVLKDRYLKQEPRLANLTPPADTRKFRPLCVYTGRGEGESILNSDPGLEQLRQVCQELGVGHHGYLTRQELGHVCLHINMKTTNDEEVGELFHKLDANKDGRISFNEFVDGLASYKSGAPHEKFHTPVRTPRNVRGGSRTRTPRTRTPLPPAQCRGSPAVYFTGESINLFSSVKCSESGFAKGEDILDFWENLNVPQAADILLRHGFDAQSKIYLKDLKNLSATLHSEWMEQAAEISGLGYAMTVLYHKELIAVRTELEQCVEESNKLRSDLSEALMHNALIAAEVDERHAQLEKSHTASMQSLEKAHQEQFRQLQANVKQAMDSKSVQSDEVPQTSEQISILESQISALKEELANAKMEKENTQKEAQQARKREAELELQCTRLKKECQKQQQCKVEAESSLSMSLEREKQIAIDKAEQLATENKVLKDKIDELVSQLEDLQQKLTPTDLQRKNSEGSMGRSSSMSRIPLQDRAASLSSLTSGDTTEWDDEDSVDIFYFGHQNTEENEKVPSLSAEMKQLERRQRKGERREREIKEIEHGFRVEIAELEEQYETNKHKLLQNLEKEKEKVAEDLQVHLAQKLAEQQRELQNAFANEKQDLLQQYESRRNLDNLHYQQQLLVLQERLKLAEQERGEMVASRIQSQSILMEHTKSQENEQKIEELKKQYDMELVGLKNNHSEEIKELTACKDEEIQALLLHIFEKGVDGLEGKLKIDFHCLVQEHSQAFIEKEGFIAKELYTTFEEEKSGMVKRYEAQILALTEDLATVKHNFEALSSAFKQVQLESEHLKQTVHQECQEEIGVQMSRLKATWDDEKLELIAQGQQLETEVAGLIAQRQQLETEVAEAKSSLALEKLRASEAYSMIETANHSPIRNKEESLDHLQSQIRHLKYQLNEARTAQFQLQQLKGECELMRQAEREQIEKEKEALDKMRDFREEKKRFGSMLRETTEKLMKTSTDMMGGQSQLLQEVATLKQKATNMVERETFTALQLRLMKTQQHAVSLQEALGLRTEVVNRMIAAVEKERRQERDSWERQIKGLKSQQDVYVEMYRTLALKHKSLRESATKMATQIKDLYIENADLMTVLQQTEAKQIASQRKNMQLLKERQAWQDAVQRMLHRNHSHTSAQREH